MMLKDMVSKDSKEQPGASLAASPLLSSQSLDLFHVFRVYPPPPHEISIGGIYIVGFRSRLVRGAEFCSNWTHEGEVGPTMQL
jgi:hypothetical protein